MIVDTSAVIAILRQEEDAAEYAAAIESAPVTSISAATVLEASLVAGPERSDSLDHLLAEGITVVAFDTHQLAIARSAHARYGRGSGSPARLNFGDCFSYALATMTGEPLLFKGQDFRHTDITPALRVGETGPGPT